jgi:hypothetical protein
MKTNLFLVPVALAALSVSTALAMPSSTTAYQGYMFNGRSGPKPEPAYEGGPRRFSFGVEYNQQRRDMNYSGGAFDHTERWRATFIHGFAGFDVFRWLTVQALAGSSDLTLDGVPGFDPGISWGGGVKLRLLDYMLLDPIVSDDLYWLNIEGGVQYTLNSAKDGADVKWGDLFSTLTVQIQARPEKFGFVDRVGLFGGVAFSKIFGRSDGPVFDEDVEEDQSLGFTGGVTLNPSDNLALRADVLFLDTLSYGGSLTFHF